MDDLEQQPRRYLPRWILIPVLLGGLALAIGLLVMRAQTAPRSVRPIVWDKQACEHCKMAISEPAFAAQLQTEDGRVLDFDDPGCLFLYEAEHHPQVRVRYFHAQEGDDWLSGDEVAFASGARSPMGYDLGAVRRGTPGALSYEEAVQKVQGDVAKQEEH